MYLEMLINNYAEYTDLFKNYYSKSVSNIGIPFYHSYSAIYLN